MWLVSSLNTQKEPTDFPVSLSLVISICIEET